MSRLSSQLRFNDLTGGINNVYDKEMINSSTRKTETPDMVNVEYFRLGGIKTMEGNTLVGGNNSIQDSAVIGGWEYTKGNNKYMIIGLANGEVRRYNEGILNDNKFELIYTFPSKSERMSFCNMNNGVVITNGIDDLVFYEYNREFNSSGIIDVYKGDNVVIGNGTKFIKEFKVGDGLNINNITYYITSIDSNTEMHINKNSESDLFRSKINIANTSLCNATLVNTNTDTDTTGSVNVPIRGLAIQYYKGRLYVGTEQGLFYSPVGEYNNWNIKDDAGVFYDIYNDNSEVTALGLYSDYMLVHKKFNTYILSDNGAGKANESLSINPFSNITCDSQQSWIVSNTKYYIYSREFMDIYPLVQRTIYNDRFLGEPITQKVREIFKDLEEYNTKNIFCVSRPKQRQMIFYMPTDNVSGSGEALIFDFQTKSWLLRRLPNRIETDKDGIRHEYITNVTCAFNFDNNIYIGTRDGLVLKEFTGKSFTVIDGKKQEQKQIDVMELFDINDTNIIIVNDVDLTVGTNDWYITFMYNDIEYESKVFSPISSANTYTEQVNSVVEQFLSEGGLLYKDRNDSSTKAEISIDEINYDDSDIHVLNNMPRDVISSTIHTNTFIIDCDIVARHIVQKTIIVDVPNISNCGLHAYYKSPWFDWAGNYYQSFSEFFVEVNSDYKNRFIIRTQKDGTSKYEDRLIDEDRFVDKTNTLVWDDEPKHWGGINEETEKEYKHDNWAKITFDTLRMLLPNNIFESFQFELKADKVGDGFHIYQYGFRRIETEEAPW